MGGKEETVKNVNIDTSLIEGYLMSEKPLHCRRTLDQYSYYMLETTESRDLDQVVYKWARKQQERQKNRASGDAHPDFDIRKKDDLWGTNMEVVYKWPRTHVSFHGADASGVIQEDGREVGGEKSREFALLREAKHRPIIMVDQLWLWILPDGLFHFSICPPAIVAYEPRYCCDQSAQYCGCGRGVQSQDEARDGPL